MKLTDHFSVRSEGSLAVVTPKSDLAIDFVEDRVQVPDYMRIGARSFAVELRYVGPILEGFLEQGGGDRESCPDCGMKVSPPDNGWPGDVKREELLCNECFKKGGAS